MVNVYTRALIVAGLMFFSTTSALAADMTGRWGFGLRAGASGLTQDIDSSDPSTEGKVGPVISVYGFHGLNENLIAGLNVEWETHGLEEAGDDIGDSTTISILPFVEWHFATSGQLSPYLSLGLGYNINSAKVGGVAKDFCNSLSVSCDFEPDNTIAVKIGAGADFPISDNLAFNTEIGWKLNSGDVDVIVDDISISADNKSNSMSILIGLRWLM